MCVIENTWECSNSILQASLNSSLHAIINDAKRFTLHNRVVIENAPLQIYCSAIVFAPQQSLVRQQFLKVTPSWIGSLPELAPDWSTLLQSLKYIALSPDNRTIVSASGDRRARLWDMVSGRPLKTLEGYRDWIDTVALPPLGDTVASGSGDCTI
ncbi:hypothetical protein BDV12DRAFT_11428 [Aspergillus spectabilis]